LNRYEIFLNKKYVDPNEKGPLIISSMKSEPFEGDPRELEKRIDLDKKVTQKSIFGV
jgi:hypothetical protein